MREGSKVSLASTAFGVIRCRVKKDHFFFFLSFFKKLNLFIYFWLRWVFVAVSGLSLVAASGGYSVAVRGLLIAVASLVAAHRL